MKNIHLIPTDKPSRIFLNKINGKLLLDSDTYCNLIKILPSGNYQHIYIINNEEIKEGDIFIHPDGTIERASRNLDGRGISKIILTSDQDLIKDGVQAIDDEFLEWFVNNPTCDEVDVEIETKQLVKPYDVYNEIVSYYKIIIPKQEQKQHLIDMMRYDEELGLYDDSTRYAHNNFNMHETNNYQALKQGYEAGATEMAKKRYSEEEVLAMLLIKHDGLSAEYVFEQFKKK